MIRTTPTRRRGFTLVELLVAIALGIVLLGIAVGVSQSSAFESYKVVGAADRVSQWMLTAKNRALRDRTPRGIRLLRDPANPNLVKEIAYIEQPEPWVPALVAGRTAPQLVFQHAIADRGTLPPGGPAPPVTFISRRAFIHIDLSTMPSLAEFQSIVQVGDLLHVPELGQSFRINGSQVATADPTNPPPTAPTVPTATIQIELLLSAHPDFGAGYSKFQPNPPLDGVPLQMAPTYVTSQFGFIRQPRPLLGEPTQLLASGMAIDLPNCLPANPTNLDILFAPSGEVIGNTDGITALLLRDTTIAVAAPLTTDYDRAGQMILVCLYGRTGAISTQPVAKPPLNSFQFAKDGVNTGL